MLEVLVGLIASVLIVAGVLVMLGPDLPRRWLATARSLRPPAPPASLLRGPRPPDPLSASMHPKTQRIVMASQRLATWLKAHGHDDLAGEIRGASGRLTSDEAGGLYAMQTSLRRVRTLALDDRASQERLKQLAFELRKAVQDRSEQLELLPFH